MIVFQRLYFIYFKNIPWILKTSYDKNIDHFLFSLKLYELKIDKNISKTIKDEIEKDPFNDNILKRISNRLYSNYQLTYNEASSFLPLFETKVKNVWVECKNKNIDKKKTVYIWNINNNYKFPLIILDILHFHRDLKTFVDNYALISSMKKIEQNNEKIKTEDNISEPVENISISNANNSLLDLIIDTSYNNILTRNLINNIFNYYKFIDDSIFNYYSIENNIITINIPNIYYTFYGINNEYLKEIIVNIQKSDNDKINHYLKKNINILQNFNIKNNNIVELMSCIYIIYTYCMFLIYNNNNEYFENKFNEMLTNTTLQCNIIKHYIKFISNIEINLNIYNIDKFNETNDNIKIEALIEKYQYLQNINNDKFIDIIFKEKESFIEHDININKFKMIDISKLSNIIYDNDLFKYKFNKNQLETPIYNLLIKYISNKFLLSDSYDDYTLNTIYKLFPILSENLNRKIFDSELNNTLEYYKILSSIIPDFKNININIILIVIYQVIIPYYYNNFNTKIFYDCFI